MTSSPPPDPFELNNRIEAPQSPNMNGSKQNGSKHDVNGKKWIMNPELVLRNKEDSNELAGHGLDPEELGLKEELKGWHGYVEWELYPERKKAVKEWMQKFQFPPVCVFFCPTSNATICART